MKLLYPFAQRLARGLATVVLPELDVRGLSNVPERGPFLLVANHQSILDPIVLQSICPRRVHTMTKSTQFGVPGVAWVLRALNAFPARRYQIDPQCVRIALRRLDTGQGVGVYIEGERSWDGRLQPPRLGTIRLILKAGVPVVPCAIRGTYQVWPRWHRRIRREPVRLAFGTPERFPKLDRRAEREAVLDDVGSAIMRRLRHLLGDDLDARTPVHDQAVS